MNAAAEGTRKARLTGIEDVRVTVKVNGTEVKVAANGLIGKWKNVDQAKLTVEVPIGGYVALLRDEDSGNFTTASPITENEGVSVYEVEVPILKDRGGRLYPDPKKALWLLSVNENGVAQNTVIALASQNGEFFLTFGETQCGQCFFKEGAEGEEDQTVCPEWGDGEETVREHLSDLSHELMLPDVESYVPSRKPQESDFADTMEGVVLYYSQRIGLGAAMTKRGEARVHWSKIVDCGRDSFRHLLPGQRISFKALELRKSGHKPNPPYEVEGIRVIG